MRNFKILSLGVCLLAVLGLSSCGSGGSGANNAQQQSGSIFTIGTDAPLPSVVSCQIMVTGVTVFNGTNNIPVLTNPQVVDFAQLSGLHQLLDLNAVPTGTYTSATVTLSSPVIGFIDTTQNPPAINTINGSLSTNSVTVQFANPFVLQDNDLVGLRMEMDLRQSLAVDQNGQVTGVVNPIFHMQLLAADDSNVSIDDFHAGFVGSTGANTFTVQGPKGRQWAVTVSPSTVMDDSDISVSSYTTNTILSISGQLDPVSKSIDATEIEVVSQDNFVLGGLLTSVRPPAPGAATQADLYVRYELPDVNGITDGQITTFDLTGNEVYRIGHIALPLTTLLFNNSAMTPGQRVDVGGKLTQSNGLDTLTVHRVILRRQGQAGNWVPGSTVVQNGNQGSFQFTDNWTAGVLLPSPLTVLTTNSTVFLNLNGLSALSGSQPISIRVVGFILIDPQTQQPVMVAGAV
ncbi:MAG TPA: DUF4382 domain-containing protein, partial [Candidatus Micrarchaeaceae archaeon]|nr:DUF4382 domain-containing protein [Candidatus Micrarchaeaceae archaeon]